jgi:hypothetical protein
VLHAAGDRRRRAHTLGVLEVDHVMRRVVGPISAHVLDVRAPARACQPKWRRAAGEWKGAHRACLNTLHIGHTAVASSIEPCL